MLKWNNLTDGWISFLCARVEAVPSFLGNDRWEGLCCFTTIGEMLSWTLRRVKQPFICLYSWFSFLFFLDKMEIKTTHLSLRLFVHQLLTSFSPQMTCMWIWPTHSFNPAAPELNLGSSNRLFSCHFYFFLIDLSQNLSHVLHVWIQPLWRGRVQRILLHFLNKTVSIHLLDNPVCTFTVI